MQGFALHRLLGVCEERYYHLSHADDYMCVVQLKNPKMVCMNLTLALDEEKPDPKPQTVMFNIINVDKAERFCSTVQDATPK